MYVLLLSLAKRKTFFIYHIQTRKIVNFPFRFFFIEMARIWLENFKFMALNWHFLKQEAETAADWGVTWRQIHKIAICWRKSQFWKRSIFPFLRQIISFDTFSCRKVSTLFHFTRPNFSIWCEINEEIRKPLAVCVFFCRLNHDSIYDSAFIWCVSDIIISCQLCTFVDF